MHKLFDVYRKAKFSSVFFQMDQQKDQHLSSIIATILLFMSQLNYFRHPEGALHVPYNSVRSSMWRWKRATTPNVPTTLAELAEILQTGEWPRYDSCTNGPFFSGTTAAGAHRAVVFANEDFIRNFGDSMYTFMDGTFKAVPRQPAFAQIFTIFATCMDHVSVSKNVFPNFLTPPIIILCSCHPLYFC